MHSEVKMPAVAWAIGDSIPEAMLIADERLAGRSVELGFTVHTLITESDAIAYAEALAEQRVREMEARKDAAYLERNRVVAALASCFPSGIARTAIEGWSEDWHGCVYIDLPTGQASWHYHDSHAHLFEHLPPYPGKWDGHTTEEKYDRIHALAQEGKT